MTPKLDYLKTKSALIAENERLRAQVSKAMEQRMLDHPLALEMNKMLQTKFQCVSGNAQLLEVDTGRHITIATGDNLDIRFSGLKVAP